MTTSDTAPSRTWIERAISPIADVRRDEIPTALLMTLLMFLVLGAYYLLKTAREVFILTEGGAEVKSYSSAGQAILLLFLVPAYAAFASKVNRGRLVTWVTLFFASNLVLFILAVQAGFHVGIVYFLWIGIFNVMVIAQFWAFANDIYSSEQGKRIFPLIGVGSSLGAWVGSLRAGDLISGAGPTRLLIGGGVVLVGCALIAKTIDRMAVRTARQDAAPSSDQPLGDERRLRAHPQGALSAADRAPDRGAERSEHLRRVPVRPLRRRTVASRPTARRRKPRRIASASWARSTDACSARSTWSDSCCRCSSSRGCSSSSASIARCSSIRSWRLIGYLLLLRAPSLQLMGIVKVADNSIDYSLGNTVKQALWLPTSREAKYKAKQAVDSFFMRMGDVIQAGIVFVGERLALTVPAFAAVNVALVGAWLGIVAMLNAETRAQIDAKAAAAPEAR